jgi:hypothetical protein
VDIPETDRPVLRCWVAKPLGDGNIGRSQCVTLSQALDYFHAGYWVIGPDLDDEIELATWERKNAHRPGWWK